MKKTEQTSIDFWLLVLFLFTLNFTSFLFFGNKLAIPTDLEFSYSPTVISLLQGKGYTVGGHFNTHHPPLFPALLAGIYWITHDWTFKNPVYPIVVLVLQSFSCGFIYLCGRELWRRNVGIVSALLLGLYPFFLVLTATKYAWNVMPFFIFIFYGFLALYWETLKSDQWHLAGFSGFLLGLSTLVWSGAIHLWLIFLIYLLTVGVKKKGLLRIFIIALFFLTGFLIPTLGWSFYVYQQTGKKIFVSSALAPTMIDGLIRHDYSKLRKYPLVESAEAKREMGQLNEPKDILLLYQKELISNPVSTIKFFCYKAARPWFGTDAEKHENWILLIQIPYLLTGLWGLILSLRKRVEGAGLLFAIILYFWAMAFLVLSILRYMIPAMGILIIFAAVGILDILQKTHCLDRRRLSLPG